MSWKLVWCVDIKNLNRIIKLNDLNRIDIVAVYSLQKDCDSRWLWRCPASSIQTVLSLWRQRKTSSLWHYLSKGTRPVYKVLHYYHLFLIFNNYLRGKIFHNLENLKTDIKNFLTPSLRTFTLLEFTFYQNEQDVICLYDEYAKR